MAISLNESETGDKGEVFRDVQMSPHTTGQRKIRRATSRRASKN